MADFVTNREFTEIPALSGVGTYFVLNPPPFRSRRVAKYAEVFQTGAGGQTYRLHLVFGVGLFALSDTFTLAANGKKIINGPFVLASTAHGLKLEISGGALGASTALRINIPYAEEKLEERVVQV